MGVEKHKKNWQARYTKGGKRIYVGSFKTRNEARIALAIARGENIHITAGRQAGKQSFFKRLKYALSRNRSSAGTEK